MIENAGRYAKDACSPSTLKQKFCKINGTVFLFISLRCFPFYITPAASGNFLTYFFFSLLVFFFFFLLSMIHLFWGVVVDFHVMSLEYFYPTTLAVVLSLPLLCTNDIATTISTEYVILFIYMLQHAQLRCAVCNGLSLYHHRSPQNSSLLLLLLLILLLLLCWLFVLVYFIHCVSFLSLSPLKPKMKK